MTPYLQFRPLYQERVWGGRVLETFLGRKLTGTTPIGESWELVDRSEAQSVVAGGPWAGQTLRQLMVNHRAEIMGPAWPKNRPFPILVKWLDCRAPLSVQVHPPANIAARLGGEPKTENWYFAQAEPGAGVYAGLRMGVTRESFERALAEDKVDQCLNHLAVHTGDSLLIESGTMHAIAAGNLILEIQQNSDTTYRVYDWGRPGLDGKPRALHVRESLECLNANTAKPPQLARGEGVLAKCHEFTIRCQELRAGERVSFAGGQQPRILSVIQGTLAGGSTFRPGDNLLLPCVSDFALVAQSDATILVTENFSTP